MGDQARPRRVVSVTMHGQDLANAETRLHMAESGVGLHEIETTLCKYRSFSYLGQGNHV
jgi:hypothetical protein